MKPALFVREAEDLYVPGSLAGSPWREGYLHGGPICGLAARAASRLFEAENGGAAARSAPERIAARLSVDLHSAVPNEPLLVRARVARQARRIVVVDVTLCAASDPGRELARASALFASRAEVPAHEPAGRSANTETPRGPEGFPTTTLVPASVADRIPPGFHKEVEFRWVQGPGTDSPQAWVRMPMLLVEGEPLTPFERTATLSDLGNALASVTRRRGNPTPPTYINPETTLYLTREAKGEWLCLTLDSISETQGIGLAEIQIHDHQGPLGRTLSTRIANNPRT